MAEEIQIGLELKKLREMKEWRSLTNLAEKLRHKWTFNQNKLSLGLDVNFEDQKLPLMENLALGRVRWAAMCQALEMLFSDIDNYIEALKSAETEDEEKESQGERKIGDINPYRR